MADAGTYWNRVRSVMHSCLLDDPHVVVAAVEEVVVASNLFPCLVQFSPFLQEDSTFEIQTSISFSFIHLEMSC